MSQSSAETVGSHATIQRVALRTADSVVVSPHNEATMAATAGVPSRRTALLPNGADPRQRHCRGPRPEPATLVFLGNLYYQPNARAVETIRTTILPTLHADDPDVRVRVIGRGPRRTDPRWPRNRVHRPRGHDRPGTSRGDAGPRPTDSGLGRENEGPRLSGRRTTGPGHPRSRNRTITPTIPASSCRTTSASGPPRSPRWYAIPRLSARSAEPAGAASRESCPGTASAKWGRRTPKLRPAR